MGWRDRPIFGEAGSGGAGSLRGQAAAQGLDGRLKLNAGRGLAGFFAGARIRLWVLLRSTAEMRQSGEWGGRSLTNRGAAPRLDGRPKLNAGIGVSTSDATGAPHRSGTHPHGLSNGPNRRRSVGAAPWAEARHTKATPRGRQAGKRDRRCRDPSGGQSRRPVEFPPAMLYKPRNSQVYPHDPSNARNRMRGEGTAPTLESRATHVSPCRRRAGWRGRRPSERKECGFDAPLGRVIEQPNFTVEGEASLKATDRSANAGRVGRPKRSS